MSTENAGRKLGWAFVSVLLLLASAEFLQRGPIRFARANDFNDFLSPYVQTTAWMKNMDPYSPRNLVALWPRDAAQFTFLKTDLADGSLVSKRGIPTAYPPASFVLLAPVAWLPWSVAERVWLGISLLAFGATLWSLIALADFHWQEKRTYLFLALALALAPFQSGLAVGSIVIVAVGLCALAMWSADRRWSVAAGVLLGIAIGLKPQIGLPFLLYYLLTRRWRVVTITVTVLAILVATAVLPLTMNHTPWVDYYRYDNRTLFARGSLGDFTESNPLRFGLINLQVLLATFVPSRAGANVAALVMTGILGLLWLLLLWRRTERKHGLLNLSALAVLSLLPVYHRLYDASLLIFPLAWSLAALPESRSKLEKGTLLLILVFLVPGGSALEQLQRTGYLVALRDSWWWNHIFMPHQVWALLVISLLLLLAMRASAEKAVCGGRTSVAKIELTDMPG
jgi:hypothetical protein